MDSKAIYDLAIIGYGLIGNTAALYLAKQGHEVLVLEREAAWPLASFKAGRIEHQALRIWRDLLPAKVLEENLYPLEGSRLIGKKGRTLLNVKNLRFGGKIGLYGFRQPRIQAALREAARAEAKLHLRFRQEVKSLVHEKGAWDLAVLDLDRGQTLHYQARYILVCDGQHSHIVKLLDWAAADFALARRTLYVETRSEAPLDNPAYVQTYLDANPPLTCITHNAHEQRWAFDLDAQAELPEVEDLIRNQLGPEAAQGLKIESSFVHDYRVKILDTWQAEDLFVLGDAAHVMPPYLGLGLSAGLVDVMNLVWKLDYVLRGWQAEPLLGTYQTEREAHVRQLIRLNLWVNNLFQRSYWSWLRYLLPILPKFITEKRADTTAKLPWFSELDEREEGLRSLVGGVSPWRGQYLPDLLLENKHGETIRLRSLQERRFLLMAWDENPVDTLWVQDVELLATWRCHFLQVLPQGRYLEPPRRYLQVMVDADGELAAWRQAYKHKGKLIRYWLIRPDGMLYDVAATATELDALLDRLYLQTQALGRNAQDEHWGDDDAND